VASQQQIWIFDMDLSISFTGTPRLSGYPLRDEPPSKYSEIETMEVILRTPFRTALDFYPLYMGYERRHPEDRALALRRAADASGRFVTDAIITKLRAMGHILP